MFPSASGLIKQFKRSAALAHPKRAIDSFPVVNNNPLRHSIGDAGRTTS
ncbi:hypothetical protein SS05631_c00150 [Sinorhizobium sp. CCBAU 05631]|nr:hypothetical protein SS05631_c00150 [Sinorhizobium sp. CCBAU 05631]